MKPLFVFFAVLCLWGFPTAHSAVILKIKGKKALVDLEGVQAKEGDKFDALNLYGKALGVLEIKKIKKGKAIALLINGKMGVNWILEPATHQASSFSSDEEYESLETEGGGATSTADSFDSRSGAGRSVSGMGLLAGPHFNLIALSANKRVSGWSLQEMLFVDFPIINPLGFRVFLGHQTVSASGANCGLSRCELLVHHLGAGFLLRAVFLKHLNFQPWVGGGGFLFWPFVDKNKNLGLDKKSFAGLHGSVTAGVGIDIHFSGFYLLIQMDLSWINPVLISTQSLKEGSKEFKPFYGGIKAGIAFSF